MFHGLLRPNFEICRNSNASYQRGHDCNISSFQNLLDIINTYFPPNISDLPPGEPRHLDVWQYLEEQMYPRRDSLSVVIPITVIYSILFITGVVGNICTCIVIARNKIMHTATNYYLFNLAIADLLLVTTGIPPDIYSVWSWYPWIFGEACCIARVLFPEISKNTTILTITAFTVERYVAICYPMKAQKMSSLHRAVRVIFSTWIIAVIAAIPITIQYGVTMITDDKNRTIPESAMCGLKHMESIPATFEVSTGLFFVIPMIFIGVLYTLIAVTIRRSTLNRSSSDMSTKEYIRGEQHAQQQARARRSVLKMLVAVVVAFFVCWAPFHTERMMTALLTEWTYSLLKIYKVLFYLSGVFYFVSCTINPVLYSIMSLKFRQALRQTLLKPVCCRKRPITLRKRPHFSKLVHGNSHTETIYTSMGIRGTTRTTQKTKFGEHELIHQSSGSNSKRPSPARSISGSSLKSTDGLSQEEDIQQVLFQIKCFDNNRNTAELVIGVC